MKRFFTIFLVITLTGPFVGHLAFITGLIVLPPLGMLLDTNVLGANCPKIHYAGYSFGQNMGNALGLLAQGLPFAYLLGTAQAAWTGLIVAVADIVWRKVSVPVALLAATTAVVIVIYVTGWSAIIREPICSLWLFLYIGIPAIHLIAAYVTTKLADAILKESMQ